MLENTRRTKNRRSEDQDSPWGSLLQSGNEGEVMTDFGGEDEGSESAIVPERDNGSVFTRINVWSVLSTLLFLLFTGGMAYAVVQMWRPQDLSDVAGYEDRGNPKDLTLAIKNAGGAEISFSEGEINRYLRDTCRMRQGGIFSLVAHEHGLAVRLHDGYAELIIDRVLSTHLHQTTAVNLSFAREQVHGTPRLRVDFRGGEPLLNSLPRGGKIGQVGLPQRYMEMLRPALRTLMESYAEFVSLVQQHGYYPEFTRSRNGVEGHMRLIPTQNTDLSK